MSGGWAIALFVLTVPALLLGYPVAFTLAGIALLLALFGLVCGAFDPVFLAILPYRLFGMVVNQTLVAVPLFVLMGSILERAKLADELLHALAGLMGRQRAGLALAVLIVGTLLAASTGIVGATVVTLGLLALPAMQQRGYDPAIAAGTLCATGTLGQLIPPSIALVLLGDTLGNAYQQAQLSLGAKNLVAVSVRDLFAGALVPGLVLVAGYALYLLYCQWRTPHRFGTGELSIPRYTGSLGRALVPPLALVVVVLGSIVGGVATPTAAAAIGVIGATVLAAVKGRCQWAMIRESLLATVRISGMVFTILVGATIYASVFRGFGGEALVHQLLSDLPGGLWGALIAVMLLLFVLGFILDFIEIIFVVVPMVAPSLLALGADPVWLGVMIAINLQTSFLTPPFGFALFYLRGIAPPSMTTADIYRGVIPFIGLQLLLLATILLWPQLATTLPAWLAAR